MILNGKRLSEPNTQELAFQRGKEFIVLKLGAVLDDDDYTKIAPVPEPPRRTLPGGIISSNVEDPIYKKKLDEWASGKTDWLVIKSLAATPDLKWEQVKVDDPKTYHLWRKELQSSGFSSPEIASIISKTVEVNGMNQAKIDEALETFLAEQVAEQEAGSPQPTAQ